MAKKKDPARRPSKGRAADGAPLEGPPSAPRRAAPAGPKKKPRAAGAPPTRISHHKNRSAWFQARASWPVREAPVRRLVAERARAVAELDDAPITGAWDAAGPANIGGRATSIVCHPTNPKRIWLGTAGGGVWSSTNAGASWKSLWHSQDVLNVGSLAIDPFDPKVLYCGTGEANLSADSYPGVGIYRTSNSGRTWHLLASADRTGLPTRIGAIAVDPFDRDHLLVGGIGFGETGRGVDDFGGLYESTDRGLTWRRHTVFSTHNYWCHSIAFHPTQQDSVLVTITERGSRNGVWRSTDGGLTWTQSMAGLPDPDYFGRTTLATCASAPDVVYAITAGYGDVTLGVFRSDNWGGMWSDVANGGSIADEGQMSYNNAIAVDPNDPLRVVCGGVDLHLTTDGGATWARVTAWDQDRGKPDYAHADQHAILFAPNGSGRVFAANDGGLDVSDDRGATWSNRSSGLEVTMFYDVDVAQSETGVVAGGTQDNGTVGTYSGQLDDFYELAGGDGGWIVFDPTDSLHFFCSSQWMSLYRYRDADGWASLSVPLDLYGDSAPWMAYMTLDPGTPTTVYAGARRVWKTTDDGDTWNPASDLLDNSAITAIEVAPADPQRVYVGTENGGFFRSTDGGATWSRNLAGGLLLCLALRSLGRLEELGQWALTHARAASRH
jgi:photosystem II stability/assembly factor-like uncharacterized protein